MQQFADQLKEANFGRACDWLRVWGAEKPEHQKIANELECMIANPQIFQKTETQLDQLLHFSSILAQDTQLIKNLHKLTQNTGLFSEDSPYRQPTSVTAKYWASVTGVIAGLAIMPFSPSAGYFLVGSAGSILLFDVIPTAVGNKIDYVNSNNYNEYKKLGDQLTKQIKLKLSQIGYVSLSRTCIYSENLFK